MIAYNGWAWIRGMRLRLRDGVAFEHVVRAHVTAKRVRTSTHTWDRATKRRVSKYYSGMRSVELVEFGLGEPPTLGALQAAASSKAPA